MWMTFGRFPVTFYVTRPEAHYPERVTPILSLCHGVFTDQFIFRTVLFLFPALSSVDSIHLSHILLLFVH